MPTPTHAPHLMLVAGESSGDALGAPLIAALREATGGAVRFSGIGGPEMMAAGLAPLFPMADLSVMGLAEVVPRIPLLRRRLREAEAHALATKPDALVTIDSPGFAFRLARRLHGRGPKLIHYVAPQVWVWRPGRAAKVAEFLDHILALLPFEPPLFEAVGLPCTFVGHPVVASGARSGDGPEFRARHGIAPDAVVLCVLPGSRHSETSRLLAPFGGAIGMLAQRSTGLRVVIPAVPHLRAEIAAAAADWPGRPVLVDGVTDKYGAMAAADAGLAASGTVSLELCLAGLPHVIAYRMSPLTWAIARRVVRTPYVNLVNVIAGREVVPEILQGACTPERLAGEVSKLLDDPVARASQRAMTAAVIAALTPPRGSPSAAAAAAVLKVVG